MSHSRVARERDVGLADASKVRRKRRGMRPELIQSPYGRAWIEHYPKLNENLERVGEIPDWRLWVERQGKPSLAKSPTRLFIESQLRAWVLRQSKRCLATLSFAELQRLAQGLTAPPPKSVMRRRTSVEPPVWEGSFGPVRRRR